MKQTRRETNQLHTHKQATSNEKKLIQISLFFTTNEAN